MKHIDSYLRDILFRHIATEGYTTDDAITEIKALFDYDDSKTLIERKREFKASLVPYIEKYGEQMIVKFFDFWTEHTTNARKMRWEKQKTWDLKLRLNTWSSRQKQYSIAGLIANRK